MPLVSATLTHRQWHDWDQTYNIAARWGTRTAAN